MEGIETTAVTVSDERLESLSGLLLAERYRLESVRARGAFCVVYHAQDVLLRRPLIIKVTSQDQAPVFGAPSTRAISISWPAW